MHSEIGETMSQERAESPVMERKEARLGIEKGQKPGYKDRKPLGAIVRKKLKTRSLVGG